mmetsp:Transcript_8901/g.22877  ORF Transcript_8901/g.22877 Transcript_8901/m.22877 type:complete len:114 (-) Transcript_8901:125-466(-)
MRRNVDRVVDIDGEELERTEARELSKKLCCIGFLGMPLMWLVNAWYFWPELRRRGGDSFIKKNACGSIIGCSIIFGLLLVWMLVYDIGKEKVLGRYYDKLDVSGVNLDNQLAG